jgi:hypothetical protein
VDLDARRHRHRRVERTLAGLADGAVSAILAASSHRGASIGGLTRRVMIDGIPVFAKGIRLTEVEATASAAGSTANLFDLPTVCHYGIGSPGFGVWRELAAHAQTTELVLAGRTPAFPLMHHWRILPSPPTPLPDDLRDVEAAVRFWDGSEALRNRLLALASATSVCGCSWRRSTTRWTAG